MCCVSHTFICEKISTRKRKLAEGSQFTEKLIQPVPGVSFLTVYDDEKSNGEKDVSIRATGFSEEFSFAGTPCAFAVTHVYWS